ncbi:Uncharacterised protein [Yersinia kristensenii]|uniref:Uncharacterized protein n=2 Tax=Yersinia TaxID=629 RepID=A0A0T9TNZ3_YERAE|nr:Uncharacterised protein [Yersinia kristensenii]CNK94067.1 Uncharacterised protein [Yersinia aleksiciae]
MMINFAANLLLIGFLIGQLVLLMWCPILSLILNSMLGMIWCYQPINKIEEK